MDRDAARSFGTLATELKQLKCADTFQRQVYSVGTKLKIHELEEQLSITSDSGRRVEVNICTKYGRSRR